MYVYGEIHSLFVGDIFNCPVMGYQEKTERRFWLKIE